MRTNLKITEGIFPMPVLMVATYNEDGSVNVMNAAWGTMQERDIEKTHEERYLKLLENVEMKKVFEKSEEVMWVCRNCGHIVIGKKAPAVCPVCAHPQSFFEVKAENY